MNNLSICLRLKISIKSSVLGKHWRALNFKTEPLQNSIFFFVTATLSKSYIIYKKFGKYCNLFCLGNCQKNIILTIHKYHSISIYAILHSLVNIFFIISFSCIPITFSISMYILLLLYYLY